jgi:hypothetical protein
MEEPSFVKFGKIVSFHNVAKQVQGALENKNNTDQDWLPYSNAFDRVIHYRGKVKLHGMNGGILITKDQVLTQSRKTFINNGLALIVNDHRDYFLSLFPADKGVDFIVIYGEWCGGDVQKGVALSKLKEKIFVIFSIQFGKQSAMFDPESIHEYMTKNGQVLPPHFYILPYHTDILEVNYNDLNVNQNVINEINNMVDLIDKEDPWVLKTFGVKGSGEGLVMYPLSFVENGHIVLDNFFGFLFKAKGEKHRSYVAEKSVQVKATSVDSINSYVDLMVTDSRLEQGEKEIGGYQNQGSIASFIKWLANDVKEEGKDELSASNLEWKDVNAAVTKRAREWWLNKFPPQQKKEK